MTIANFEFFDRSNHSIIYKLEYILSIDSYRVHYSGYSLDGFYVYFECSTIHAIDRKEINQMISIVITKLWNFNLTTNGIELKCHWSQLETFLPSTFHSLIDQMSAIIISEQFKPNFYEPLYIRANCQEGRVNFSYSRIPSKVFEEDLKERIEKWNSLDHENREALDFYFSDELMLALSS